MLVPMVTRQSSSWGPAEGPSLNFLSHRIQIIQFQITTYSWRNWKATTLIGTMEVNVDVCLSAKYSMLNDHRKKVMQFKQMGH